MNSRHGVRGASIGVLALVALGPVPARLDEANPRPEDWTVTEAMVPMRDGVRLHTKILAPRDHREPLPFLMLRTPYGIVEVKDRPGLSLKTLADEGYIFVFQDIRGKFGSEGAFVMQRPAREPGDKKALDEGTDTYDTIDWLLANVAGHNARVGMLGVSYLGWTTIMGALEPHPALKAISPQASPADMWLGDDFHHNGAFRLSYGFEYAYSLESGNENKDFAFDRYDTFGWYLALGPLANVNARLFHGKVPTWNDYVAHPDYDEFWKRQTMIPHLRSVKVPTLSVAGWWDQEDFYGPLAIYQALEKHDTQGLNRLVVGPWNHGGWRQGPGDRLGPIAFDSATGKFFRDEVEAAWFAHYLKDRGALDLPEALTFEAGSNRWRRWEAWPPAAKTEERRLYFGADRTLATVPPPVGSDAAFDSYVSDPAHPVPYRRHPIQATYFPGGSQWRTWLVEDQRFVDHRADVLSFETAPLDGRPRHRRRGHRPSLRRDDGERRRLDRQAHRRLPRGQPGELGPRGLSAHGLQRGLPRTVSEELREARGDHARGRARLLLQPAHPGLRVPARPPADGAGAEHVVPPDRPQSPDLRPQHLHGEGDGLPPGHAPDLPLPEVPVARVHPRGFPRSVRCGAWLATI